MKFLRLFNLDFSPAKILAPAITGKLKNVKRFLFDSHKAADFNVYMSDTVALGCLIFFLMNDRMKVDDPKNMQLSTNDNSQLANDLKNEEDKYI